MDRINIKHEVGRGPGRDIAGPSRWPLKTGSYVLPSTVIRAVIVTPLHLEMILLLRVDHDSQVVIALIPGKFPIGYNEKDQLAQGVHAG